MRQLYILCVLMVFLFGLPGCFEDDSTLGTKVVPDIQIAELRDTTIVSYSGKKLEISPVVTTDYPRESLSFAWYYYADKKDSEDGEGGYRKNRISETRDLSYEVNLPSGTYIFVFEVTSAENNYVRTQKMKVMVTTEFVGRFYVLKETAEGNSDLDLIKGTTVNPDVVTKVFGAPMSGAPVNLSYIFNQGYRDDATQKSYGARAMYVFTEKDSRVFNTEDMAEIINNRTFCYEEFEEGEVPCGAINALVLMMFTNKGFYFTQPFDPGIGAESAGRYGLSTGAGGSRFMVAMGFGGTGFVYWSELKHHLYVTDFNGQTPTALKYDMPAGVDETGLSCVGSGQNYVGGVETNWFLTENTATGDRYLYLLDDAQNVTEIRRLDASLHIAKADIVAAKGLKAAVIYSVDGNSLWYYDWIHNTEDKVILPGVGTGETLAYVSNQFLQVANAWSGDTSYDFDNLIVGTQEGDTYRLYFYDDVVGAMPQKAVKPAVGKGKVKSIRFAAPVALGCFDLIMPNGPLFPLCD